MEYEDEEIKNASEDYAQKAGYISLAHCEDYRSNVIGGLVQFGNHWAMSLGYALNEANLEDSIKIMRYWNQLCEQHAIIYKMYLAKEKALNNASD